jgi:hypothetical protein
MATQETNKKNTDNLDWIGVSSLAKLLNVSKQTIYNRIRRGVYPTKNFARGTMNGMLVGVVKQNGQENGL